MSTYRVTWEIDLEAESPEDAAVDALDILRDPFSTATHFELYEVANDGSVDFDRPLVVDFNSDEWED